MNQRDYLEVQIEQLGRVLKAMLGKMLGTEPEQERVFFEELNEILKTDFEFSPDKLSALTNKELDQLLAAAAWNRQNEDYMLQLWLHKAEQNIGENRLIYTNMARTWLSAINRKSDSISFERLAIAQRLSHLEQTNQS